MGGISALVPDNNIKGVFGAVAYEMQDIGRLPWDVDLSYRFNHYDEYTYTVPPGSTVEEKDGSGWLLATRYRITTRWAIGGEYLWSNDDFTFVDDSSDDLAGFYDNNGTSSRLYVNYSPEPNMTISLGVAQQKSEYFTSLFSTPVESDKEVRNFYTRLYLNF